MIFHQRYKDHTGARVMLTPNHLRAMRVTIARDALTDTTIATIATTATTAKGCTLARVTMTKDLIGAKTAARAITTTGAATDIGPRTFTRATAASKFLAAQGFQRMAHLRRVAHGLAYLHLIEWRTYILEAISRVGALFEDQRTYIFRVERLTMERL